MQLLLDDYLSRRLEREARLQGVSKSELVRRILGNALTPPGATAEHPFWELVGIADAAPDDSSSIDDVVYGPAAP